jgi:WD40 repeat protein
VGEQKVDPAIPLPAPDVIVWDVASRKVLLHRELKGSADAETAPAFAFSPDGATVATIERTREARKYHSTLALVDVDTGRARQPIEVAGSLMAVSFSPDGKRLAGAIPGPDTDGLVADRLAVWDAATGGRVSTSEGDFLVSPYGRGFRLGSRHSHWSPDGTRLAIAEPLGSRIHLLDAATGKVLRTLDASNRGGMLPPGTAFAFSPDGRRFACVVRPRIGRASTVNVLDTDSGKELLSLPIPTGGSPFGEALRFTPDGHRLLHFLPASRTARPAPGQNVMKSSVVVTAWDATPLPGPKQP